MGARHGARPLARGRAQHARDARPAARPRCHCGQRGAGASGAYLLTELSRLDAGIRRPLHALSPGPAPPANVELVRPACDRGADNGPERPAPVALARRRGRAPPLCRRPLPPLWPSGRDAP